MTGFPQNLADAIEQRDAARDFAVTVEGQNAKLIETNAELSARVGVVERELAAAEAENKRLRDGLTAMSEDFLDRRDRNRERERANGANLARYNSGVRITFEGCARAARALRDGES